MRKKIKVLIVDDSGYVITSVTKKLNTDPGIEVIGSARNGIEAVEKVKSLKPDVVTLDVIMPKMDGSELVERLQPERPEMRVLYMSGYTDRAVVKQVAEDPNVAFLPKPFNVEALTRKVREVLNRTN